MKRPKRPRDPNQLAKLVVDISTGEAPPDPDTALRGQPGGVKGGKARAARLTQEQRSQIATLAAQARWKLNKK